MHANCKLSFSKSFIGLKPFAISCKAHHSPFLWRRYENFCFHTKKSCYYPLPNNYF